MGVVILLTLIFKNNTIKMNDLFVRGVITPESNTFIIVGGVYSSSIGFSESKLLNYTLSRYANSLQLNFSTSQTPVVFGMIKIPSTGLYKLFDATTSTSVSTDYLCYSSEDSTFFFQQSETGASGYQFDLSSPVKNLPLNKILSGTWYSVSIDNTPFPVMSTLLSLVGTSENGYFSNDALTTTFLFDSLTLSFLPTSFYDINGVLHSSETPTNITERYMSFVENPSTYESPPVASWLGESSTFINAYTQIFTPPMMWYSYCDFTTQCGDCFGSIIFGGIECSVNSQLSVVTPSPEEYVFISGKPFITSGAAGNQGGNGLRGNRGTTSTAAASGPTGRQGLIGESKSTTFQWNSPGGILFLSIVIISLVIIIFTVVLLIPQYELQFFGNDEKGKI